MAPQLVRTARSDSLMQLLFDMDDADMRDGDQKDVSVSGTSLTFQPSGNDQIWTVQAHRHHVLPNALVAVAVLTAVRCALLERRHLQKQLRSGASAEASR